jgi:RNA polymerase sigma factor (sigma-70 family)
MTFEALLRRLAPKIKAIAYKTARVSAVCNAEDLYQEAVVHLWEEYKAQKTADKTDSYLLQGCFFFLKNYLRTHLEKRAAVSLHGGDEEGAFDAEESRFYRDERAEHFFDYLNDKLIAEAIANNGLSPREKKLLPYFSEGLTVREIGRRIGVSHVRVIKMREAIRSKCLKHIDA